MIISTCIITYNQDKYIEKCIKGALEQKLDATYEIVIGDDSSTDQTSDICGFYAKEYPELIKYIRAEKNVGMNRNWINTIKNCSGKYIAYCEGDDYWIDPFKLKKQVEILENNTNFVGCGHNTEYIYEWDPKKIDYRWPDYVDYPKSELEIVDHINNYIPYHTSSYVFRNLKIELPDFFFKSYSADICFFTLMAQFGKVKIVDEVMSVRRKNSNGLTVVLDKFERVRNRIELYHELNRYFKYRYNEKYTKLIIDKTKELKKMSKNTFSNNTINSNNLIIANYSAQNAKEYEENRNNNPKWKFEDDALDSVLNEFKSEIKDIIDAPIGTGRFLDKFQVLGEQIQIFGIDYSSDMLKIASEKSNLKNISFSQQDIINNKLDVSGDLTICFRFLNLINWEDAKKTLNNLFTSSKKYFIFSIRTIDDNYTGETFIENKIYLHRKTDVEKIIKENYFEILKRFEYKDKRQGDYSLILCKKNKNILSCRVNKNFKIIYNFDQNNSKGKIYQVKDHAHANFLKHITTSSQIQGLFPKIKDIQNEFIHAEWSEGERVEAIEWDKVIELLVKIQGVQNYNESSFDYVENLILPRFYLTLPIIGLDFYNRIISMIKTGSGKYQKKVSHPDVIPDNVLKTSSGYKIIDNELLCYSKHHRIDILNSIYNLKPEYRENILLKYLVLSGLDYNILKEEYSYLQALWLARQAGSFIIKGKVESTILIIKKYLNQENILPFKIKEIDCLTEKVKPNESKNSLFQNTPNINYYFGMTSHQEQDYFEMYTSSIYTGTGEIVDLGSWFGATTIKLAKGLSKREKLKNFRKIHAFDRFIWKKSWEKYKENCMYTYEDGESFLSEFSKRISPWKHLIEIHAGDLNNYKWQGSKIEFLLIDAMKGWDVTNSIMKNFFPYLIPYQSYIVQQDFKHYYTSWIHLLTFRFKEHFELITSIPSSSSVVFKYLEPIPENLLKKTYSFDEFSNKEVDDAFNYSISLVPVAEQANIIAAKMMLFIHKNQKETAFTELRKYINKGFSIDNNDLSIIKRKYLNDYQL